MKNTKVWTRVFGIIAMLAIIGFSFIACEDGGGGGGGGKVTFKITNNHTVAIKSIVIQSGNDSIKNDVSVEANGGTATITMQLNSTPIGTAVHGCTITFTDDTTTYPNSGGVTEKKELNITVTGTGSNGMTWDF